MIAPVRRDVDSSGNVYIAENGDGRIRKVDTKGNITTVVGDGISGFAGDGGDPPKAQINCPPASPSMAPAISTSPIRSNLRIRKVVGWQRHHRRRQRRSQLFGRQRPGARRPVERAAGRRRRCRRQSSTSPTPATTPCARSRRTASSPPSPATASRRQRRRAVEQPRSRLAVDAAGNLYIADTGNSRSPQSRRRAAAVSESRAAATSSTPPPASRPTPPATSTSPISRNNRVRRVSTDGAITTVAGNGVAGLRGDGGPGHQRAC